MRCPACRVVDVSEIRLHLRNREITLHACVRCEHRWWDEEGEPVALEHVLGLASPAVAATA